MRSGRIAPGPGYVSSRSLKSATWARRRSTATNTAMADMTGDYERRNICIFEIVAKIVPQKRYDETFNLYFSNSCGTILATISKIQMFRLS